MLLKKPGWAFSFNDGIKCSHRALLICEWARLPYPIFADVDQESWETNNFPKYNQLLHEGKSGSWYSFYSQLLAWFLAVDLQDISKREFQLAQSMYECLQGSAIPSFFIGEIIMWIHWQKEKLLGGVTVTWLQNSKLVNQIPSVGGPGIGTHYGNSNHV